MVNESSRSPIWGDHRQVVAPLHGVDLPQLLRRKRDVDVQVLRIARAAPSLPILTTKSAQLGDAVTEAEQWIGGVEGHVRPRRLDRRHRPREVER